VPFEPRLREDDPVFITEEPRSLEDIWTPEYEASPIFMYPEKGSGYTPAGYGFPVFDVGAAHPHGDSAYSVQELTEISRRRMRKADRLVLVFLAIVTVLGAFAVLLSVLL
jgi:hypothetical protein